MFLNLCCLTFVAELLLLTFFAELVGLTFLLNFCQTPDLGQGLEFDFTFANNKNNDNDNPHLNFPGWDGTRGLKFGTQT